MTTTIPPGAAFDGLRAIVRARTLPADVLRACPGCTAPHVRPRAFCASCVRRHDARRGRRRRCAA